MPCQFCLVEMIMQLEQASRASLAAGVVVVLSEWKSPRIHNAVGMSGSTLRTWAAISAFNRFAVDLPRRPFCLAQQRDYLAC